MCSLESVTYTGTTDAWIGIVSPSMKNLFIVLRPFQIRRVSAKEAISATNRVIRMVATATMALFLKYHSMCPVFRALS